MDTAYKLMMSSIVGIPVLQSEKVDASCQLNSTGPISIYHVEIACSRFQIPDFGIPDFRFQIQILSNCDNGLGAAYSLTAGLIGYRTLSGFIYLEFLSCLQDPKYKDLVLSFWI